MVSPYIIRVRQVAHSAEPLLFGITAVGQSTLDLKLEVFDEENREYCVNINDAKAHSLLARNSHVDEDEWKTILRASLLPFPPSCSSETVPPPLNKDIELRCQPSKEQKTVTLIWRRGAGGLTQKLGEVNLTRGKIDGDQLDWFGASVDYSKSLERGLRNALAANNDLEQSLRKLQTKMEDLVQTKENEVARLFIGMRELMNEKKRNIFNLQRLLAACTVEPGVAEDVKQARQRKGRSLQSVRRPKPRTTPRVADQVASASEDASDSEDSQVTAPRGSEDETEVEDDDEPSALESPQPRKRKAADANDKSKQPPSKTRRNSRSFTPPESDHRKNSSVEAPERSVSGPNRVGNRASRTASDKNAQNLAPKGMEPPPRRDLPFSSARNNKINSGDIDKEDIGEDSPGEDDDEL